METDLLKLTEVADMCGINVGTIRGWVHKKTNPFPLVRLGRSIRVHKSDVEKWLESCVVPVAEKAE